MRYTGNFESPLGGILLACDESGLTDLLFTWEKIPARLSDRESEERETPFLLQAKRWLDIYFSGREPDFLPPLHLEGTPFQLSVWQLLLRIPYGGTTTYGEIAKAVAAERGIPRMSAQAVGGAVGRNPVSIIVPCHRVVGAGGNLTGYAGGLWRKLRLLALEGADTEIFHTGKGNTL